MKTTLTSILLLAAGLAAAQDDANAPASAAPTSAQAPQAAASDRAPRRPRRELSPEERALRRDIGARRVQLKELNVQEKAAIEAVKADAARPPADKADAIEKIRADYRARKGELREKLRADLHARRRAAHPEAERRRAQRREHRAQRRAGR